ncbi:MAG: ABC transporter ATP-binding protein, partial [Clostridiales bacterium]|nr:ABC transporter ATP-binding protein [Clostridiales bacterium]
MAGPGFGGPVRFLTEEEKQSAPKLSRGLLKRIFSYMTPYWVQFLFVFITILVSATIGLMPAIITGRIVDDALVGKNMTLLVQLLIAAFAAMLVSQLVGLVENYINAWISQQIIFDMRNQMYRHLLYMPHSFFTTEKQGDIITRMNSDISGVGSVISGTLANIVNNIAVVLTTLVALFRLSPPLAAVGIVAVPLLVIPTRMAGRTRWKYLSLSQAKSDELNQKVDETLSVSGAMLVRIFTREEKEYKDFVNINKEVTGLSLKEQRAGQLFRVAMGMFNQIGPLLIYFCGGYFIIRRIDPGLTVGIITSTVSLVNRINRPVEQLLNLSVDFTRSLALFSRIFDYFDKKNPITSPENGVKPDVNNKPVTYEHVAFSYSPDSKILKDVNFEVPGGAMYAIVGPSGSGKSTV